MRETVRAFKRSLPPGWKRQATAAIQWAYAARAVVKNWCDGKRWQEVRLAISNPDFPHNELAARVPKWHYLEWLASSEVPASSYLRRHRLPLSIVAVLLIFSRKWGLFVYVPPSQRVKARAIRTTARRYGTRVFIETGTYLGETVAAVSGSFDRCITIELAEGFWRSARETFRHHSNVECVHGDSGVELQRIVGGLSTPALFWLDAHASGGDTVNTGKGPIFEELRTIFRSGLPHVVLIDDARGHRVEAIRSIIPSSHRFDVRNDIMRITPRS